MLKIHLFLLLKNKNVKNLEKKKRIPFGMAFLKLKYYVKSKICFTEKRANFQLKSYLKINRRRLQVTIKK